MRTQRKTRVAQLCVLFRPFFGGEAAPTRYSVHPRASTVRYAVVDLLCPIERRKSGCDRVAPSGAATQCVLPPSSSAVPPRRRPVVRMNGNCKYIGHAQHGGHRLSRQVWAASADPAPRFFPVLLFSLSYLHGLRGEMPQVVDLLRSCVAAPAG